MDSKSDFRMQSSLFKEQGFRLFEWISKLRVPDDLDEALRTLSLVNYIQDSTVPILTIHGTEDAAVLPAQAELLHQELNEQGVRNRLHWVEGRKHGDFTPEERTEIHQVIWEFLSEVQVLAHEDLKRR